MIDHVLLVVLILFCAAISQLTARPSAVLRLACATLPGLALVVLVNAISVKMVAVSFALSVAMFLLLGRVRQRRARALLPYSLLLLVFVPDYFRLQDGAALIVLGSAFYIVRQFITVRESLRAEAGFGEFLASLTLATLFFPSLFVGPVFNGRAALLALRENRPARNGDGLFRVLEGFVFLEPFSFLVRQLDARVGRTILQSDSILISAPLDFVVQPLLAFAFIFTTFFGYSRIAEGSAKLLGFEVPENFRRPWLAVDFADFWSRWHRSMADFVMQYIYLPLSIHTRRPRLAMVSAFFAMGVWHEIAPGYMLWGLLHGLAVGWLTPALKAWRLPTWMMRVVTLAGVVYVSYLANHWFFNDLVERWVERLGW